MLRKIDFFLVWHVDSVDCVCDPVLIKDILSSTGLFFVHYVVKVISV